MEMTSKSILTERCPACGKSSARSHSRMTDYPGHPCWVACGECLTEFLVPQPDDARLSEIYGPEYYEAWEWETSTAVRSCKARTFLRALRLVEPESHSRLLDVGCARGELASVAVDLGLEVAGVDLNAEAIRRAQEDVPTATFFCGQLHTSLVGSNWDVVTMFDFIEHVRDPGEILRQAASVLAMTGKLLISTPSVGSIVHRLTGRLWPQYREEHLVLFSELGMRNALETAGLTVETIMATTKYCTPAYLLGQMACYAPPIVAKIARRSDRLLRYGVAHFPLPLRFGEMTIVATAAS